MSERDRQRRERERKSLDQRGDSPSTIDFAAVVNPRRNWLESRLRARYFVATRIFLPGRFYRRSRHHEGEFLPCYLSPGFPADAGAPPRFHVRFYPAQTRRHYGGILQNAFDIVRAGVELCFIDASIVSILCVILPVSCETGSTDYLRRIQTLFFFFFFLRKHI